MSKPTLVDIPEQKAYSKRKLANCIIELIDENDEDLNNFIQNKIKKIKSDSENTDDSKIQSKENVNDTKNQTSVSKLKKLIEVFPQIISDQNLFDSKELSRELLEMAIALDPLLITSRYKPDEELQLIAVNKRPSVIHYFDKPSEKVIMAALKKDPKIIQFLPYLCEDSTKYEIEMIRKDSYRGGYYSIYAFIINPSEKTDIVYICHHFKHYESTKGYQVCDLNLRTPLSDNRLLVHNILENIHHYQYGTSPEKSKLKIIEDWQSINGDEEYKVFILANMIRREEKGDIINIIGNDLLLKCYEYLLSEKLYINADDILCLMKPEHIEGILTKTPQKIRFLNNPLPELLDKIFSDKPEYFKLINNYQWVTSKVISNPKLIIHLPIVYSKFKDYNNSTNREQIYASMIMSSMKANGLEDPYV